jgi:hypothetical protein
MFSKASACYIEVVGGRMDEAEEAILEAVVARIDADAAQLSAPVVH